MNRALRWRRVETITGYAYQGDAAMAIPIYRLYLIKPHLEVYLVSEQQRSDMIGRAAQSLREAGGRSLLALNIWSDGQYPIGGVEEYPDLQALREHNMRLRGMLW